MAGRKLQNFAGRSYRFAAAIGVFHVPSPSPACGEGRGGACLTSRQSSARDGPARQLTCRAPAPKTRLQFGRAATENAAFREKFNARCVCLRCRTHPDRPLRRFARQSPRRRSGGGSDQGADGAASQARLGPGRRSLFRLRQPGRRGQPQRGADGAVAGRPAGIGSRPHAQSALRLRARCGRCRRPRNPRRRDRFCHCRRRRIDDAGAVRDGQGARKRFRARPTFSTPPSAGASSIR